MVCLFRQNFLVYICLCFILELGVRCEWNKDNINAIELLTKQWAPLLWLSPEEKFMPLNVQDFLENVNVADSKGNILAGARSLKHFFQFNSKNFFLVPKLSLDFLKTNITSFLYGTNPKLNTVPVYAVITQCDTPELIKSRTTNFSEQKKSRINFNGKNNIESDDFYSSKELRRATYPRFHVTYWMFYPYNEGKEVCFLGKVPTPPIFTEKCFGHLKKIGNHVGDWEHTSLYFNGKKYPDKMFLSVHDAGAYYSYDSKTKIFKFESKMPRKGVAQIQKFPPFVRVQGGHPVLFAAKGSHGVWSSPGDHNFIRVPKIIDKNGFGTPWKTWTSIEFYHHGKYDPPYWMTFKGKWGTPKSKCLLLKRFGLCEYTEGPSGLLRDKQDFYC